MKYNDSIVIPADKRFLSGVSSARLRSMQKKETDPRAAARLLAYAMRKEGMSVVPRCRFTATATGTGSTCLDH